MRILFISDPLFVESIIYNEEGYANLPMLESMPCALDVATTADQAKHMIGNADVVLLESLRGVQFRDELSFINKSNAFVGAFYCDVWRAPFWYLSDIKIDLNICVYKAGALKVHSSWKEGENFLWLPPRVKPVDYIEERDVDIVTWGAMGREYPFRNFSYQALLQQIIGGPRRNALPIKLEPGLTENTIRIRSEKFKWHQITGKRMQGPFYGSKLMDALSRCKVCPTGPVVQNGIGSVVARFFENAAAGVISITSQMPDAEALGFRHGDNIWFSSGEQFFRDLDRLLFVDTGLRQAISENAHDLITERHSVAARGLELYDVLVEKTGGR